MTAAAALLLVLGCLLLGLGLLQNRTARRRRVAEALDLELAATTVPTQAMALALQRTIAWADRRTEGTPWSERTLVRLEQARIGLRPAEWVGVWVGSAVVGALVGGLLGGPALALAGAVLGAAVPPLVLARRAVSRTRAFEAQLAELETKALGQIP